MKLPISANVMSIPVDFEFPYFYHFPPFYTIQPVLVTRDKQLAQWRELILKYRELRGHILYSLLGVVFNPCYSNACLISCLDTDLKIKTLVLHECPLWRNASIGRELSRDEIQVVMDDFVKR
eukprot:CCRYP_013385-RE/>CCRYP_013385-RE protein AED:0.25 eAED:0.25 QI:43/1/1/1/1/0.75/4/2044/121